jgi:hypothetical protein
MDGYIRDVSGQRHRKHVPAAKDTNTTIEELCFMRSVPRYIKQGTRLKLSQLQESVKRGLEPEALLEPLPGNVY